MIALVAIGVSLGVGPAGARTPAGRESGVVRLDSATAVARGASALGWRDASPLDVPDRFGPGQVLTAGNIRMKVINNGTLGNPYPILSTDPAAQWPGNSGIEYLNSIALAVAAVNPFTDDPLSKRRVSYFEEWRPPTLDPVDRIYSTYAGAVNGERFFDDDGDSIPNDPDHLPLIDEDFLDGRDNDLDGLIDEDHAALGQQQLSFVIRDDTPEAVHSYYEEPHVPIGLETKIKVWSYAQSGLENLNVVQYDITNVSDHRIDSLVVGWYVDIDAGPVERQYWEDDVAFPGYPSGEFTYKIGDKEGEFPDLPRKQGGPELDNFGELIQRHLPLDEFGVPFPDEQSFCPNQLLRVNGFSVGDNDGDNGRTPGMGSFTLIDFTRDPTSNNAPQRVGFRSFRTSQRLLTFSQGGMPATDEERFRLMESREGVDFLGFINVTPRTVPGDYVALCSVGPWRRLQPGQTVSVTVAFSVTENSAKLASQYPVDVGRLQPASVAQRNELIGKYPALANALAAQIAFEGISEYREGYLETKPQAQGGRDAHGRETPMKLPPGSPPQLVTESCGAEMERVAVVTDQQYTWFNWDCDYCTGVYVFHMDGYPARQGLFHHTWYYSSPPPNPRTNLSPLYNFTDNPDRAVVASEDHGIRLAWDNRPEVTEDPNTHWIDFRGVKIWKSAGWQRPVGTAGPREVDWALLGEYRAFDYYRTNNNASPPIECNYTRNATTGEKVCPRVFIPGGYDPVTKLYGKMMPICLDRYDLWNWHTGEIIKPTWTVPCEYDTTGPPVPFDIDTDDLEWNVASLTGGSWAHVFPNEGRYPYLCMRHITQKGTVVVEKDGADSATVEIRDAVTFVPATVTIRPGGSVRWLNKSTMNHALQTDRHCQLGSGFALHHFKSDVRNRDMRPRYPVGRYQFVDREVHNGFNYLYSIAAFDSSRELPYITQLAGRRVAFEAEAVSPQASIDAHGKKGVWVVPNPYRGYARILDRPSAWDMTPSPTDPTGTHIDFFGLPPAPWTIRIYTLAGDFVQEIHPSDAINESVRHPVHVGDTTYPGVTRQQDNPNDGQARWNLVSRNGQDVASGIYLFTVDSSEGSQRGKFVIIR